MNLCGRLNLEKIEEKSSKTQHEGGVLKRNPSHKKFPSHKVLLVSGYRNESDLDSEEWTRSDLDLKSGVLRHYDSF